MVQAWEASVSGPDYHQKQQSVRCLGHFRSGTPRGWPCEIRGGTGGLEALVKEGDEERGTPAGRSRGVTFRPREKMPDRGRCTGGSGLRETAATLPHRATIPVPHPLLWVLIWNQIKFSHQ